MGFKIQWTRFRGLCGVSSILLCQERIEFRASLCGAGHGQQGPLCIREADRAPDESLRIRAAGSSFLLRSGSGSRQVPADPGSRLLFSSEERIGLQASPCGSGQQAPLFFRGASDELGSGCRAHRRRCQPLSPTTAAGGLALAYRAGRTSTASEAGCYPRIPRLDYVLHLVGSGWLLQIRIRTLQLRSMWLPETASTPPGGLSQAAAVFYVLYSLASRLGLLLRQIRIQRTDPHQFLQLNNTSWARLTLVASEVSFYIRGTAPWPRLPSTSSSAVEIRASTSDPGVFLQQYGTYGTGTLRLSSLPQPCLLFYRARLASSGLGGRLLRQRSCAMASPVL